MANRSQQTRAPPHRPTGRTGGRGCWQPLCGQEQTEPQARKAGPASWRQGAGQRQSSDLVGLWTRSWVLDREAPAGYRLWVKHFLCPHFWAHDGALTYIHSFIPQRFTILKALFQAPGDTARSKPDQSPVLRVLIEECSRYLLAQTPSSSLQPPRPPSSPHKGSHTTSLQFLRTTLPPLAPA